ncbi:MAG: hypothetical protein RJQ00_02725 [Vicingaceae bacterium]
MITREQVISEPTYWVEELNGKIYDAIVRFMEAKSFKQKDMAKHLGISAGRMSQILNTGDINFSYEKIVSILLKLDLIPHFDLESKADFIKKELNEYAYHTGVIENKPFKKPEVALKVVSRKHFHAKTTISKADQATTLVSEAEVNYSQLDKQPRLIA